MTLLDKILGKSEHGTCGDCKIFVNRHGDSGLCILYPKRKQFYEEYPKMYRDEDCNGFERGPATLEVGVDKCETCVHFTPKLRGGGLCSLSPRYDIGSICARDDLCGKYRRNE